VHLELCLWPEKIACYSTKRRQLCFIVNDFGVNLQNEKTDVKLSGNFRVPQREKFLCSVILTNIQAMQLD
jgi:hypothetical protein